MRGLFVGALLSPFQLGFVAPNLTFAMYAGLSARFRLKSSVSYGRRCSIAGLVSDPTEGARWRTFSFPTLGRTK